MSREEVNMKAHEDELVQVAVPRRHLMEVYAFVASLNGGGADAPVEPEGAWPLDQLVLQYRESPESLQRLQKHLAAHAGEEFDTHELADVMGLDRGWNSVAGALGAYGHRLAGRYGGRKEWPFNRRYDHVNSRSYLSMSPDVAEVISKL